MATATEFLAGVGIIPVNVDGENADGCVCLHRQSGKDGRCINAGHPICEKDGIGLKRELYIIRKTPGHA